MAERKPVRTYTSLWNHPRTLFAISDLRLPVPVLFRQIGFFLSLVLVFFIVFKLPGLSYIADKYWYAVYLIGPGYLSWLLTNKKFDGKDPLRFIYRMFHFYLTSGKTNRYEDIDEPEVYKYSGSITYRQRGETND